jgi:soluble lytic murein transglycosylase-like protein
LTICFAEIRARLEEMKKRGLSVLAATIAGLVALTPQLHAAERITLNNGFVMRCDHHAQVESRVRLYLSAGEDNYIEFAPEQIAAVEAVPDPPAPAIASAAVSQPNARLTPADIGEMLARAGKAHNIDVDLLASVVKAESGGNPRALSSAGAQGLMQLMPGTANELGVSNSFAPEQNVRGGSTYLDELLSRYHDNLALALAAYNAGPAAVDKYHGIPPYSQTRVYVARVIHEFNRRVLAREAILKQSTPGTQTAGNR